MKTLISPDVPCIGTMCFNVRMAKDKNNSLKTLFLNIIDVVDISEQHLHN